MMMPRRLRHDAAIFARRASRYDYAALDAPPQVLRLLRHATLIASLPLTLAALSFSRRHGFAAAAAMPRLYDITALRSYGAD